MLGKPISCILFLILLTSTVVALNTNPVSSQSTITVPDDYPTIQEAINNANEGDTIFVKRATYYENVVVNRTILLIGEERETTIIDARGIGITIELTVDGVLVSNFTISYGEHGIHSTSSHNHIIRNNIIRKNTNGATGNYYTGTIYENNIVKENTYGLNFGHLSGPSSINNTAKNNEIYDNTVAGVYVSAAYGKNTLVGNNIHDNGIGIVLDHTENNNVIGNSIRNNNKAGGYMYGIYMRNAVQNNISTNLFQYNNVGIHFENSNNNEICHNNFVGNGKQEDGASLNIWDDGSKGNYWSNYLTKYPDAVANLTSGTWNTPYAVDGDNIDHYPLVNQAEIPEFSSFVTSTLFMMLILAVSIFKHKQRLLKSKK